MITVGVALSLPWLATAVTRTLTPPMGWNSYNYYNCYPNETIIKSNAWGLVELGLSTVGYNIVTPDCGWPSKNRTADGQITWNPELFPSGFPALGEYIHGLGLKFGLYSGAGVWECTPDNGEWYLQASLGHEVEDAHTFATWGGDALKYDNCWANKIDTTIRFVDYNPSERDPSVRFAAMSDALSSVNRSIIFSICQWGVGQDLGVWAPKYGNTWRISNDIQDNWKSIWRIVNQAVPYVKHTGVGKYIDMDILTVGLGALSYEEERFHFGMWAISKSPLVIGAPANSSLTPAGSLAILLNKDVVALNQDRLGEQAQLIRRYTEEGYDIFAGNISGSRKVIGVANWSNSSKSVDIDLQLVGVQKSGNIQDVWAAKSIGPYEGALKVDLEGHEAKLLILPVSAQLTYNVEPSYYSAVTGILQGDVKSVNCGDGCLPTGSKVTNMTIGSSVTFGNVSGGVLGGTKLIGIDYINYDVALASAWTNGTNTRNFTLSVNGREPRRWSFPISGGDWYETGRLDVLADGFYVGPVNELRVEAPGLDPGADLVGFAVYT
ncbi:carbohydrate-binding module family 35 protein [Cenococcum geophilum 1.58]|uniref:carbohydrate-binding module family 35 protein n=1 Tax=Cenococcum geophilum 1.58 TaxID=794803 RepID=UPI00359009B5|nr:carbohydrate-binding module family 35 protein [Cenococcum geophilum 1.58]